MLLFVSAVISKFSRKRLPMVFLMDSAIKFLVYIVLRLFTEVGDTSIVSF